MSFLFDSIDLFTNAKSSHMGPHQYASHKATRSGKKMSGDLLWAEIECAHQSEKENMNKGEQRILPEAARAIRDFLPNKTGIIDLGPGTVQALKTKTMPFLKELNSDVYIPVDQSVAFLYGLVRSKSIFAATEVRPIIDDFFLNTTAYSLEETVSCSFGSTISNLVHPVSLNKPTLALIASLRALAASAQKGWLLISFDSNQNGEENVSYYRKHNLFQLNIFDRMAVELPIEGSFDPLAFEYEPLWIKPSGQLAHMAVAKQDMEFTLGGHKIQLKKDQALHLKNSYKFTPAYFESCAAKAGLSIMNSWSNDSSSKLYLLRKEVVEQSRSLKAVA